MSKTYRASITFNGRQILSPRFKRKADRDQWRLNMELKKKFAKDGMLSPIDNDTTLGEYFKNWLVARKKSYPASTWKSDEQRFKKYVEPMLGVHKLAKINQLQVRTCLKNVVEEFKKNTQTRNRVRSLLSKIFNDSMNEETPLRQDNPALGISFQESRTGKKKPLFIGRDKDVVKFLKSAKAIDQNHLVYASLGVMAGLRRQEIIALRWNDFNAAECHLIIDEKHISVTNEIVPGTKAGSQEIRTVPIPDELIEVLSKHKSRSDFQNDEDFILQKENGEHLSARNINTMNSAIVARSGVSATPHALRHTFGRQFALKSGNMKVLQTILGHSSSSVTEIYSELAGKQANKHRNTVTFNIEGDDDE